MGDDEPTMTTDTLKAKWNEPCSDCGVHNPTSWRQHDTGCSTAKAERATAVRECMVGGCRTLVSDSGGNGEAVLCERHANQSPLAMEVERERTLPEVARPPVEQRPIVHQGEVAAVLFNDLRALFGRLQQLEAFEQHVMNAAKSPAAWLSLRQELAK